MILLDLPDWDDARPWLLLTAATLHLGSLLWLAKLLIFSRS